MIIIISEENEEKEIEKRMTDIKSEVEAIDELRQKYINELNELRGRHYQDLVTAIENLKEKLNDKKID